jgi:hypothetical protein
MLHVGECRIRRQVPAFDVVFVRSEKVSQVDVVADSLHQSMSRPVGGGQQSFAEQRCRRIEAQVSQRLVQHVLVESMAIFVNIVQLFEEPERRH